MREVPDPYRVLGLRRDAGDAEIKAAHRRLAKRFHPDAADGDTERFLAVQEAYRVLIDPPARREWDRQHTTGPVRANDAGARRDAGATRARTGRPASAPPAREPAREAPGTPPPGTGRGGSYTWSAREVPWWEDPLAPREARRQPGRRRPGAAASSARGPAPDTGTGAEHATPSPDASPDTTEASEPLRPEMDVYSRSSGAAWSQAARAYFRRHDLPPPGRRSSWQGRQGPSASPPPPFRPEPARAAPRPTPAGERASARGTTGRPGASRAGAAAVPGASSRAAAGTAPTPRPAAAPRPRTAPVRSPEPPPWTRPSVPAAPAPFPTLPERAILAALAWIPIAIVIAYVGGALTGCGRAAAGCSPAAEPLQALLAAATFAAFLAMPRISWFAAVGSVATLASGLAILFALAAIGVDLAIAGAAFAAVSFAIYALAVVAATRDRPLPRPWLMRGRHWASGSPHPAEGGTG